MSVVVAIKENDKVIMACDSQASTSRIKFTLTNKNNYKMFSPQENLLIGVCGAFRTLNLLYCMDDWIDELAISKNEVDFKYIVRRIVPKIMQLLKDNDLYNEKGLQNLEVLIAYKNLLYEIDGDLSVVEIDDFATIGSGCILALGYLNISSKIDVENRVLNAVKTACETDLYVSYPIILGDTTTSDFTIKTKEDLNESL